jgi:para-aminobenzoate synthetase component 1
VRKKYSFAPDKNFIQKALQFAGRDSHVVYLNPNSYSYPYGAFKHVLAFGVIKELKEIPKDNFPALQKFLDSNKEWAFGYLSYDLKNETEKLSSNNEDRTGFSLLNFFIPKHIIFFNEHHCEISSIDNPEDLLLEIKKELLEIIPSSSNVIVKQKISREEYLQKIQNLKQLILKGDLYEINFCQEYFVENIKLDPLTTYLKLNEISPMPFSCFLKHGEQYLLCASPERFIKKENQKLISQPIKGTAKRDSNPEKDIEIRLTMENSQKERSENIMIVDLVRNDLSKSARPGSVKAEEICTLHSFPQVHQMISTITSELSSNIHPVEAIKQAFPMGSMTGAPKVRALQVIEEYEETKRGLFSGCVGYFTPEMDFDFNVVIRSILYNADTNYLSFQAGSAITHYADAEKEYEECGVKTAAIREILEGNRNRKHSE